MEPTPYYIKDIALNLQINATFFIININGYQDIQGGNYQSLTISIFFSKINFSIVIHFILVVWLYIILLFRLNQILIDPITVYNLHVHNNKKMYTYNLPIIVFYTILIYLNTVCSMVVLYYKKISTLLKLYYYYIISCMYVYNIHKPYLYTIIKHSNTIFFIYYVCLKGTYPSIKNIINRYIIYVYFTYIFYTSYVNSLMGGLRTKKCILTTVLKPKSFVYVIK